VIDVSAGLAITGEIEDAVALTAATVGFVRANVFRAASVPTV
jgi:hypothetical protein